jgi:hypothetical protein
MADEKTVGDAANRLVDGVEAVAQAVEKIAPEAWETMVTGQRVEGIASLAIWVVIVAVSSVLLRIAYVQLRDAESDRDLDTPAFGVPCVVGFALLVFAMCGLLVGGDDTIIKIFAPEYAAGMHLLEMVKQ